MGHETVTYRSAPVASRTHRYAARDRVTLVQRVRDLNRLLFLLLLGPRAVLLPARRFPAASVGAIDEHEAPWVVRSSVDRRWTEDDARDAFALAPLAPRLRDADRIEVVLRSGRVLRCGEQISDASLRRLVCVLEEASGC